MPRQRNTNRNGAPWTDHEKWAVWQKGLEIQGNDPSVWRSDICGHTMKYAEHGNRESEYGWEIDHILAVANGGSDLLGNLQPLNWENNAAKGDSMNWRCGQ